MGDCIEYSFNNSYISFTTSEQLSPLKLMPPSTNCNRVSKQVSPLKSKFLSSKASASIYKLYARLGAEII